MLCNGYDVAAPWLAFLNGGLSSNPYPFGPASGERILIICSEQIVFVRASDYSQDTGAHPCPLPGRSKLVMFLLNTILFDRCIYNYQEYDIT